MKRTFEKYYQPTPNHLRKLGDALLGISTFVAASAISGQHEALAYVALGIGVIGKFLTNFFTEE